MRHQASRLGTLLDFLLDGLAQLGDGRVESIQQLQQVVSSPARPLSQGKRLKLTKFTRVLGAGIVMESITLTFPGTGNLSEIA